MQNNTRGSRQAIQWDESSFFAELQIRKGTEITGIAKNIIKWVRQNNFVIDWGKGESDGGFQIKYNYEGKEISLISVKISGKVKIWFYRLHHETHPFKVDEKKIELLNMLNGIKGISIPRDKLRLEPTIPIAILINESSLIKFLEIIEWISQQLKSGRIGDNISSIEDGPISQQSSCVYLPTREDFESAYRVLCSPGQRIDKRIILDQIEQNAINSGYNLKENWRLITKRNIKLWTKK